MNEETLFPTEVFDSLPPESAPVETESPVAETTEPATEPATEPVADDPGEQETTVPETLAQVIVDSIDETEATETTEVTETTETVAIALDDVVNLTAESTSILANIILCGALMVVGVLCGIRFWR